MTIGLSPPLPSSMTKWPNKLDFNATDFKYKVAGADIFFGKHVQVTER